jgi:hypothetical protein
MAMNLWECDHDGCDSTAVGVGGAAGLLAIGWCFQPGPTLLCPAHRPDKIPCDDAFTEIAGQPCGLCKAEDVAEHWQNQINEANGWATFSRRRRVPVAAHVDDSSENR